MNETIDPFIDVSPRLADLERLDLQDMPPEVRAALDDVLDDIDKAVQAMASEVRVRRGGNRGGDVLLFRYSTYSLSDAIDPVVVGFQIRTAEDGMSDSYHLAGDIAGELNGDVLFESPDVVRVGTLALTEAIQRMGAHLRANAAVIIDALKDDGRAA